MGSPVEGGRSDGKPPDATSRHQTPSEAIRSRQKPSEAIRSQAHLGGGVVLDAVVPTELRRLGELLDLGAHLRYGETWGDVGRCGEMWGELLDLGTETSCCAPRWAVAPRSMARRAVPSESTAPPAALLIAPSSCQQLVSWRLEPASSLAATSPHAPSRSSGVCAGRDRVEIEFAWGV